MSNMPFPGIDATPREHFRLHALAATAHLLEAAGRALGSHEGLLEQFPFAAHYLDEIDALGALPPDGSLFDWPSALVAWEALSAEHLPLRALSRAADLERRAILLLVAIGLVEEDGRLGALFECLLPSSAEQRPTVGVLNAWWNDTGDVGSVQRHLRRLRDLGLVEISQADAPRTQWTLRVPPLVWDAVRGDFPRRPTAHLTYVGAEEVRSTPTLVASQATESFLTSLPGLIDSGQIDAIVVRGPNHNGRFTALKSVACALGRGVLHLELAAKPELDAPRAQTVGVLATLLHALPVVRFDALPGETLDVPAFPGVDCPVGVILGRHGGLKGESISRAVTWSLDLPSPALRRRHVEETLGHESLVPADFAHGLRLTSGNLRRALRLTQTAATLAGREVPATLDLREASRTLGRQALETLATLLPEAGSWGDFASGSDTLRELRGLESRCRFREDLQDHVGAALAQTLNAGVRALFQGPSGTGKTLAARLLASSLGKDLYRVDLSAVVNKYIGETEKNLSRVFSAAEELDVVLLFDEGDALLARRTGVSNANDRHANLETNFLLQRLESFEGIALVTTNAIELIDDAFQRRMDAIIDFRAPDPPERWSLWQLHLPDTHAVDTAVLREVASRCQLTGGQIRNAVLHASLMALADGSALGADHLEGAIQREYKKSGGVCPLRRPSAALGRN